MEDNSRDSTYEKTLYIRKIRKPMVEKRRRDRMNNGIAKLKALIGQTINEKVSPLTRLDKADILELTVHHLAQIQQPNSAINTATEVSSYSAGFKDCLYETVTYLARNNMIPEATVGFLNTHLHNMYLIHQNQSRNSARSLHTLSTPARPAEYGHISMADSGIADCSPIPCGFMNTLGELTFCFSGNNSNVSRSEISNNNSLSGVRSINSLSGIIDNKLISIGNSGGVGCCDSRNSSDTYNCGMDRLQSTNDSINERVTGQQGINIVVGHENVIGHVITDPIWRPW